MHGECQFQHQKFISIIISIIMFHYYLYYRISNLKLYIFHEAFTIIKYL